MSTPETVCRLDGATAQAPDGRVVLSNVTIDVPRGVKIGVVGPDREANSALLRLIAEAGIATQGASSVGYLGPTTAIDPTLTVEDFVEAGVSEARALIRRYDYIMRHYLFPIEDDIHEQMAEMDRLQKKLNTIGGWDLDVRVIGTLEALRCPQGKAPVSELSQATQRRLDLARQIITRSPLTVLDEPTDELDAESVAWLDQTLNKLTNTLVIATRDRALLHGVVGVIIAVEGGTARMIEGGYGAWLEQLVARQISPSARASIERELAWMREGMPGRRASIAPGASTFSRWLARRTESTSQSGELTFMEGPRLGDEVLQTQRLSKGAGAHLLFDNLNLTIPPGAIVGVIGGESAGKTTLLGLLAGRETPDKGGIAVDDKVKLGVVDDAQAKVDPQSTVLEAIARGRKHLELADEKVDARDFVAAFGFTPEQQAAPVGSLPPVMQTRVGLARLMLARTNFLLLDEPELFMDIDLRRAFEDALIRFVGCAIIVSNDRWFLNRVATHTISFEGDSRVQWFEGNFDAYIVDRMHRTGQNTIRPSRLRFKLRETAS